MSAQKQRERADAPVAWDKKKDAVRVRMGSVAHTTLLDRADNSWQENIRRWDNAFDGAE
jgi:hypothetical protein